MGMPYQAYATARTLIVYKRTGGRNYPGFMLDGFGAGQGGGRRKTDSGDSCRLWATPCCAGRLAALASGLGGGLVA
jgi:hypothetical protein